MPIGSVVEKEETLVRNSRDRLCCVFEQDTLSSALYYNVVIGK